MPFLYPAMALAFTVLALMGGKWLALKYGFADQPGGRKKHDIPVPPIGGLVIMPVFLLVCYLAGLKEVVTWPLMAGIAALLAMGAIDDAKPLRPWVKFTIMVWTACFVVIFGEAQIAHVGNLFGYGTVELGMFSKAFTVMCLVLLMNSINMMDGIDGFSGGFCALVAFWIMVVCSGQPQYFMMLSILLAVLIGFLVFNMRTPVRARASVFMGDSGTLCLGLLLGWFCIQLTQSTNAPLEPITTIWIIAVPVMDAFALFIARSARGLHPFNADRRHLHHRFLDAGVPAERATFYLLALSSLFALIGFVGQAKDVPPVALFALWMVLFIGHTVGIMHPRGYTLFSRALRLRRRE